MTCTPAFAFICSIFSGHADVPSKFESMPKAALVQMIKSEADRQGVPHKLAIAVAKIESDFNVGLKGNSGEYGIFQVMPQTARHIGFTGEISELYKPETNIHYGVKYLAIGWKQSRGDPKKTAVLYNEGHQSKRKPIECWQQWDWPTHRQRYECRLLVAVEKM